ncbi:Trm112 family protein [soil metagenome]
MTIAPELLALLACPEDKGPLYYLPEGGDRPDGLTGLVNPRLRRLYRVVDGIPVMLIDEAVSLDDAELARVTARIEAEGIAPTFQP